MALFVACAPAAPRGVTLYGVARDVPAAPGPPARPGPAEPGPAEPGPADPCRFEPDPDEVADGRVGCQDLLPAALVEFTGVIVGLEFRAGEVAMRRPPPALARAAAAFSEHPRLRLVISGHGDEREAFDLSRRRAELVRAYLIARGVRPEQIEVRAVGADEPLGSGRSGDRRVELALSLAHAWPPAPAR